MAISLSNHEDRIKKLEGARLDTSYEPIFEDYTGNTLLRRDTKNIPMDFSKYDAFILVCGAGGYKHPSGDWKEMPSVTSYIPCSFLNGRWFTFNDWYTSQNYDGYYAAGMTVDGVRCLQIKGTGNSTPDTQLFGIYGVKHTLKLYYNFSYNIYSLANSIPFHFFKCLINSFKGGVKEIWQLV